MNTLQDHEKALIAQALAVLDNHYRYNAIALTSSEQTSEYFRLKLSGLEREVFSVAYLNSQHTIIKTELEALGTIDKASIYPREIVKQALHYNAAAVIFAHNHPSGNAEPSNADIQITHRLKDALALIDVRVLDHVIIGDCAQSSMASMGII